MKAYVLTTKSSCIRLKDGKIDNYPTCLPEPEVMYGYTVEDGMKAPEWYIPHQSIKCSADINWCIIQGKLDALKYHLDTYPDEDCILLEDDVYFCDDFDIVFPSFMSKVPDNWDMLFIGGYFHRKPIEVKKDVLKCTSIVNHEFLIIRSTFIQTIIDLLESGPWGLHNQIVDGIVNSIVKDNNVYAPIPFFAGQKSGYSYNFNRNLKKSIITDFNYVTINGTVATSSVKDYHRYKINNIKMYDEYATDIDDIGSIALFGPNKYYLLCTLLFLKNELPKLDIPVLIHADRTNAELLDAAVLAENISTDNVYLRIHKDSYNLEGMLWRYEPNLAKFTHTFDVDMKLPVIQLEAIKDYKSKNVDWYTCWSLNVHKWFLGGMSGINTDLLHTLYPLIQIQSAKETYEYCSDENALTEIIPILSNNGILYKSVLNMRKPFIDNVCIKNCIDDHTSYKLADFIVLNNYSNGKYVIAGKPYTVNEKGRK